jgi:hypothetical protein
MRTTLIDKFNRGTDQTPTLHLNDMTTTTTNTIGPTIAIAVTRNTRAAHTRVTGCLLSA